MNFTKRLPLLHAEGSAIAVSETPSANRKVSIVISNYNYAQFIGQAIQSSLSQDYGNLEVVVVDDGSTDNSHAVIRSFEVDPRLISTFQINQGQAAAINRGYELSTGQIVLFLDGDDMLKPNAVSTVAANWADGLSHIQFPMELIDEEGLPFGLHPFSLYMEDGDAHWQMVVGGNYRYMPTSGNAFARAALSKVMPIPPEEWRICADTYLTTITPKSGVVKNLTEALGLYRVHATNNWYTEVRSQEKAKTIWRNHVRVWRTLVRHITPRPRSQDGLSTKQIRDRAALYHHRRIMIAHRIMVEAFTRKERREVFYDALMELVRSSVPFKHKLLYLPLFGMLMGGGWSSAKVRGWLSHRAFRPFLLGYVIERLKGPDFYGWMRMRERPATPVELEIGKLLRFGRGGVARHLQWYGWTRSDQYLDWCIGSEAALVAIAPDTRATLLAEFEVLPYTSGDVRAQRIEILCNDITVYNGAVTGRSKLRMELSPSLWKDQSLLVLRFRTPDFINPRLVKQDSEDYRPLTVAFAWIKFSRLDEGGGERKAGRAPFLPVGGWIDLATAGGEHYLTDGWRRTEDGFVRMVRSRARIRSSILEPSASDYVMSVEFLPESRPCPIKISFGKLSVSLDLQKRYRADLILGRGTIPKTGELAVVVEAGAILGARDRGLPGDQPAGPAIVGVRLQMANEDVDRPLIQLGEALDFRAGGNGKAYIRSGWYPSNESGVTSSDTVAQLEGLLADPDAVAFLTAGVAPPTGASIETPLQLRVSCNGALLARYDVDAPCEICAIIPAELVKSDRRVLIDFQTSTVTSTGAHGPAGFTLTSLMIS